MTAVFDTNVVVSALAFRSGACASLRRVWSTGEVVPVVSRAMVDELVRVLAYLKLRLSGDDRLELLGDYLPFVKQLGPDPPPPATLRCADPADQIFVDTAVADGARYLVSGDRHLLDLAGAGEPQIVTVADFLAAHG